MSYDLLIFQLDGTESLDAQAEAVIAGDPRPGPVGEYPSGALRQFLLDLDRLYPPFEVVSDENLHRSPWASEREITSTGVWLFTNHPCDDARARVIELAIEHGLAWHNPQSQESGDEVPAEPPDEMAGRDFAGKCFDVSRALLKEAGFIEDPEDRGTFWRRGSEQPPSINQCIYLEVEHVGFPHAPLVVRIDAGFEVEAVKALLDHYAPRNAHVPRPLDFACGNLDNIEGGAGAVEGLEASNTIQQWGTGFSSVMGNIMEPFFRRHTTLDALLSSDETVIFETLYNAPMIYLAAGWPRACVDHLHNMLKQDREQGLNNADFHRFAADVIRDLGGR